MKKYIVLVYAFFIIQITFAQDSQPPVSLSKSLGLFVFPNNNQTRETQAEDETFCYNWAREQTGFDPINPTKVEAKQADASFDGSALVGGAKGAAAGAAIGAIAGDTGKGAAIGSVVGGLAGRRARLAGDQREQAQNNQAASAQEQEMVDNFKKAFTACMEGKSYTIK